MAIYSNMFFDTYMIWDFISRNNDYNQLVDIVLSYCSIPVSEVASEKLFNDQSESIKGKKAKM